MTYSILFLLVGIGLGFQFFFFSLMIVLMAAGVEVIPLVFDRVPLDIEDNIDFLRGLSYDERNDETNIVDRLYLEGSGGERTVVIDTLGAYFRIPNGNVLTTENLKLIQQLQNEVFAFERYQKEFCLLDNREECVKPSSIIKFFDGSLKDVDEIFNDPNFDNIVNVLHKANTLPETKRDLQQYLGKVSNITATSATTDITRFSLYLGFPLNGYSSEKDREEDQKDELREFCLDDWTDVLEKHYDNGVGEMEFYFSSIYTLHAVLIRQVTFDLMLAVGSIAFIVFFTYFQTQSWWVAFFSIQIIFSSFTVAILIYRFFMNFEFFGVFHVLSIFIILGIGAGNTFVLFDLWKETAFEDHPTLAHRLSAAFKKAASASFFTSATTAAAFIVSGSSPFLSVSSFGIFSALLVCVSYVLIAAILPTTIITYHLWWEKFKCCCCCVRQDTVKEDKRWIVKFFEGPYYKYITHKVFRWINIVCMLAFVVFCGAYSSKIKIQETQVLMYYFI